MADDDFRPYRGRDPRDETDLIGNDANDPLAELARLIGQNDPYADAARPQAGRSGGSREEAETSEGGWPAEQTYAEESDHREEERYAPRRASSAASDEAEPQERGYDDAPPPAPGRYFSGPAAQFGGFREETDAEHREERRPAPRPRELPAYATAEPEEEYASETAEHDDGEAYADEHYDDYAPPRRRGGVILVMVVFALAVVGTAGAFGYRAMFGKSFLPSLPPIIKASNGPNKIVPSAAEIQAKNTSPAAASSGGSTVHLVSREEQPLAMEPPKVIPRVVETVPVASEPGAVPAGSPWPSAPAPASPAPMTVAPNALPPAPVAAGAARAPAIAPAATPAPAAASTAPKRIHTVIIHGDQNAADAAPAQAVEPPAAAAPAPPRSQARAAPAMPKPAPRSTVAANAQPAARANAPLSIMPGSEGQVSAPVSARPRAAAAPVSLASAGPVTGVAAAPASGHGYDVQVTSQRTETEAQAEFRTLRAKYPDQLGSRAPIIRRADLGAKGTYYRAMIGPFASLEEAAGMCSRLKAAGGSCLVQRN